MKNQFTFLTIALLSSGYAWAMYPDDVLSEETVTVTYNKMEDNERNTTVNYTTSSNVNLKQSKPQQAALLFDSQYDNWAHSNIWCLIQQNKLLSDFLNNLRAHLSSTYKANFEECKEEYKKGRDMGHVEGFVSGATVTAIVAFIYITFFLKCDCCTYTHPLFLTQFSK